MKRWIWIPMMTPVMWGLWGLVLSADRLHAWQYSDSYPPPTSADHIYAAIAFWTALLTPILIGLLASIVAFHRAYPSRWPILETAIIGFPYIVLAAQFLSETLIMVSSFLVGGVIVLALLNLGACARQRTRGKCWFSGLAAGGGTLYLLWLYSFIIYIDT